MTSRRLKINKWFTTMAFLVMCFLLILAVRAEEEEEECGNNCHTVDPDPSQMSRCVRYACRRRVFRYFIRFGKRGDTSMTRPDLQPTFLADDAISNFQAPVERSEESFRKRNQVAYKPDEFVRRQQLHHRRQLKLLEMLLRFG